MRRAGQDGQMGWDWTREKDGQEGHMGRMRGTVGDRVCKGVTMRVF